MDKLTKEIGKERLIFYNGPAGIIANLCMEVIMLESAVTRFNEFRSQLHASFPKRRDALLELTDALAGNTSANSPVALSLGPLFSRCYGSLHDAVDNFFSCYRFQQDK